MSFRKRNQLAVLTATGVMALVGSAAQGATVSWVAPTANAGTDDWDNNPTANWSTGAVPGVADVATFNGTASNYAAPDISAASTVTSIDFTGNGFNVTSTAGTGSFLFNQNGTQFIESTSATPATNSVNVPLTSLSGYPANVLSAAAGNTLVMNGAITFSASSGHDRFAMQGAGTIVLNETATSATTSGLYWQNSSHGSTSISTLDFGASNPLGVNTANTAAQTRFAVSSGTLSLNAIAPSLTFGNAITGSSTLNLDTGSGAYNFTLANVVYNTVFGSSVSVGSGKTVTLYGLEENDSSHANHLLTLNGSGTLLVTGQSIGSTPSPIDFQGGYKIAAGATLLVDGTATSTYPGTASGYHTTGNVVSGGTLGGTGTLNLLPPTGAATQTVIHTINGTVAPGDPNISSGVGTLTFGSATNPAPNNVTFGATSVLSLVLGGTAPGAFSSANVYGNVAITSGATVTTKLLNSFTATLGQTLDVLDELNGAAPTGAFATPVSGTNSAGTYGFTVGIDPANLDDIALTVVSVPVTGPVPTTWALSTGGSWNSAASWSAGIPNGQAAQAFFTSALTSAPGSVTLDGNETVGQITFNNTAGGTGTGYSIDVGSTVPTSTLTIDDTTDTNGNTPTISVVNGNHAITAPIILAKGLTVSFQNSSGLTVSNTITENTPGAGVTVTGAGTLTVATGGVLPANDTLTINNTAKVALFSGATPVTQTIAGLTQDGTSQLDIGNNELLVTSPTAAPGLRSAVMTGYNGGNWNGPGINSSAAAASGNVSGLGYANGADGVVAGLSSGTSEVMYTYLGDANLDGKVTVLDLDILASGFGISNGTANWDQGDFSYDGNVSVLDLDVLATHFGDGTGISGAAAQALFATDLAAVEASNPAFAQAIGASVPEPGTLSILAIGAGGLLARRRRAK